MIFDFKFWHYFARQGQLIHNLQESEMRNFNRRLGWILALGVLVFAMREIWGMNTASLTPFLAEGEMDVYTLARWSSLLGTVIWAGIYLSFHSYGAAFLFHKIVKIPWRAAIVMQTYVTAILVIEKALVFFLFAVLGYTMKISLFSFGPMAATFLEWPFLTYFFNQLTVFSALIIAIQYRFLRNYLKTSPKLILFGLILLHIVLALIVASMSLVPLDDMIHGFVEGGVPGE